MIVIHAAFHEDRMFIWGEASAESHQSKRSGPPKTRQAKGTGARYLFEASSQHIASVLCEAVPRFKPRQKSFLHLAAWLPTRGDMPVPSSSLIAVSRTSRAKIKLKPWLVTAYGLGWGETVDFLCASSRKRVLVAGVIIGDDVAFWSEALRFAGSLVARQHYLPSVDVREGSFHAVWKPIYFGDDSEELAHLASRMPAAARALAKSEDVEPPCVSSVEILKRFVNFIVDRLVRSSHWDGEAKPKAGRQPTFESVHDAWLHGLRSSDDLIRGDKAELERLAAQAGEWARPITVTAESPFRLCFRLEEPTIHETPRRGRKKTSSESWYVRYLLQPRDDLSLLIPMEVAWKPDTSRKPGLFQGGPQVIEHLLTALGQASALCPSVAGSLKTAEPEGYSLDVRGAHDFLRQEAILLQQAGFGVMLPAWWTGSGANLRLSVSANVRGPKMRANSDLSLDKILQFEWEVSVGDKKMTLDELMALASLKAPLVRIRGQWVELDPEQIRAAADLLSKKNSEKTTARDVIQMALGAKEPPHGLPFEGVNATGWIGTVLKQFENREGFSELKPDQAFSGELRPYQERGLSWLGFLSRWGMGACLADDMGLGKTVQTLALIQRYRHSNGNKPVLLVCPTTVVNNWQKEASRFTPDLAVMIHHGAARNRGAAFKREVAKHALVVSSYGLLHRDVKLFQGLQWSGVILDEAQNIKNPETQQARAARSLNAGYRIALTGTPLENNVGDLWSIMEFLNPGFLGNQAQFKRKFFVPIQAERNPEAVERLKRITGPFILRRLKTDKSIIGDLPDKIETKAFCPLTKEQASLYAAVVKDTEESLKSSEGMERKGLILATLSKLKQVCNHPAHFLKDNSAIAGRSGKLARLAEMLEEVTEIGDRALVFTQFSEMGRLLQRYLQESFGAEVLFLHGGVTRKDRDRMVDRFQSMSEGPSIFVLSLKAGGTGLNLTAANHVFHFDRWWNPAVENQATDRAFRIGQTKNVQVHKFVCAGTLEEKIDEMIERKKDVAEKVVGTGEGWITELSNKDLKELWKLRKDALGD
jgi:SNF2 family DNA or RNA helicase